MTQCRRRESNSHINKVWACLLCQLGYVRKYPHRDSNSECAFACHRSLVCRLYQFGYEGLVQDIRFELIRVAPQSLSLLRLPFSPILQMHHEGFEPFTFCGLKSHASTNWANGAYQVFSCSLLSRNRNSISIYSFRFYKSRPRDSNPEPSAYKADALAN